MSAMPVMICVLCLMAIAYRYYSAFLAAKVAALDDARATPAVRLDDGQNYHPTNKWVLFGHHFAAISGAGPLIGPVLAAQFGYLPGLLWIVIGVCLGGAVQDFLVLCASMRRDGKSLAQIAFSDIGRVAGTAAMVAIIFILIIALAGLGKVVVKALGGEPVNYGVSGSVYSPAEVKPAQRKDGKWETTFAADTLLAYENGNKTLNLSPGMKLVTDAKPEVAAAPAASVPAELKGKPQVWSVPAPGKPQFLAPGSSWGTFTIACTIPIALFVGLYMYRIRRGRVVEASLIGGALTLVATVAGGWVANHWIGQYFNLTAFQVTMAMAAYGFVASVLPVWVLLCPRDYLSSFLKIGTIALLVVGTLVANPKLEAPSINHTFLGGGPTVSGKIFPFLFITVMCGAISGFHALVSSGTTPKMVKKERDARMIGYTAMLIEGLVAVVALIAATTLPVRDYYAMNTELSKVPAYQDKILRVAGAHGPQDVMPAENINEYERRTQESLRGRTGGAVTLAVGMAHIFDGVARKAGNFAESGLIAMWKYWYHFAIMFEALFILTTIDTGTRIGRFLIQEVMGKVSPRLGRTDWWPGAIVATLLVVAGWSYFINSNNFDTIWKMFGIANQMLAVIALAVVSCWLANEGRARYLWVTVIPMAVVMTTTGTAAVHMLNGQLNGFTAAWASPAGDTRITALFNTGLLGGLVLAMVTCTAIIIVGAVVRIRNVLNGEPPAPRTRGPALAAR